MSRCFPFPPSSYRRADESLLGSIKIVEEQEKATVKRKEKVKKEQKEKREKSRGDHGNLKHGEHSQKKRKYDDQSKLDGKNSCQKAFKDASEQLEKSGLTEERGNLKHGEHIQKKRKCDDQSKLQHGKDSCQKAFKDASEQLEKSGLTEDHGRPCSIQEPCESSESTQNSSKIRKVEAGGGGMVLRIRLPLQKHKDSEPTSTAEEPCFLNRVASRAAEQEQAETSCSQSSLGRSRSQDVERNLTEQINRISQDVERLSKDQSSNGSLDTEAQFRDLSNKISQDMESLFGDLITNWKPVSLPMDDSNTSHDDQDWLFGTSSQKENSRCRVGSSNEGDQVHGNTARSLLQPRAIYLPEFNMYQLPYTIPF